MFDAIRSLFLSVGVLDEATAPLQTIDKAGGEVAITLQQIDRTARVSDESLQKFSKGALVLGGTLAAAGAAGSVFFSSGAERADKLNLAYNNMVKNMGADTDTFIAKMKEASAGTVDEFDIIARSNEAMAAGLDKNALPEMMLMAQAAARRGTGDIATNFEQITQAVKMGQGRMINRMGIIVDNEVAEREYAKTLGKTAEALTDLEKKQAFQNAVLAEGKKFIDNTDMSQESLNITMAKAKNNVGDLQREFSKGVIPVLNLFYGIVDKVASIFISLPGPVKTVIGAVGMLGTVIAAAGGAALLLAVGLTMANTQIAAAGGISLLLSGAMGILSAGFWAAASGAWSLAAGVWAALAPFIPIIAAVAALILLIQDLWTGFNGGDSIVMEALGNIWESIKGFFSGLWDVMKSVGKFLIDALLEGMTFGVLNTDRLTKIFDIIRQYLPFSDAKVGPLSDLTLSGQRLIETFGSGAESKKGYLSSILGGLFKLPAAALGLVGSILPGVQTDTQQAPTSQPLTGIASMFTGGTGAPAAAQGGGGIVVNVTVTGNTISGDEGSLKTLAGMTASAVEDAVMKLLNRQAMRAGI